MFVIVFSLSAKAVTVKNGQTVKRPQHPRQSCFDLPKSINGEIRLSQEKCPSKAKHGFI